MSSLVIADTSIRRDAAGRFCLNDLHRASGGSKRSRPAYFLARSETKGLIAELESEKAGIPAFSAAPVSVVRGRSGGTFVAEDLVVLFAMWISPRFCLAVIRAFRSQSGRDVARCRTLLHQRLELEAWDAASREKGSIGSLLLHGRRRERVRILLERAALDVAMQADLFLMSHDLPEA